MRILCKVSVLSKRWVWVPLPKAWRWVWVPLPKVWGPPHTVWAQGSRHQMHMLVDGAPNPPPPPPPLPPSFNFYKAADTSQEGPVTPGAGLFVFNSKPADTDVVPGQGVAPVGPPPPLGGGATPPPDLVPPEVSTAASDSEVAALLAQQLSLDSSVSCTTLCCFIYIVQVQVHVYTVHVHAHVKLGVKHIPSIPSPLSYILLSPSLSFPLLPFSPLLPSSLSSPPLSPSLLLVH